MKLITAIVKPFKLDDVREACRDGSNLLERFVAAAHAWCTLGEIADVLRLIAEHGADYPVAQRFFSDGDVGSLVNVAGVGVLRSSNQPEAASAFVEHLLSEEAQRYFSQSTYEFPLLGGVAADPRLPAIDSIEAPDVDLSELADLQGTVELLRDVGAID